VFIFSTPEANPATAVLCNFSTHLRCFKGRDLWELYGKLHLVLPHYRDWDACIIYLLQLNHAFTPLAAFDCGARHVSSPLDHEAILRATSAYQEPDAYSCLSTLHIMFVDVHS
jgi:hypothetical protein